MIKIRKEHAPVLLRFTISIVILWFGFNQLINPSLWYGWLPSWVNIIPFEKIIIIYFNGIFEIIFGLLLILGIFTRLTSLIISLHLLLITIGVGYNDVAVRDFGLTLAAFSIFLYGPDNWSLDKKIKKRLKYNWLTRLLYIFNN